MQGNPYRSKEVGLGPLMRDVKNKICTGMSPPALKNMKNGCKLSSPSFLPLSFFPDCELVALLEDDTGMELLVCNKIISLDLPVKEVYKKIWCAQPNVSCY